MPGSRVYIERFLEFLRGHDEKARPFGDHAARVVGETAVGVTDVLAPLEHDDFRFLV
jgi:hypothetical protein